MSRPSRRDAELVTGNTQEGAMFAMSLDGELYVSVFAFDGVATLVDAMRLLDEEPLVFVGVSVTGRERRRVMQVLGDAATDAAAHLVGGRPRTRKRGT